MSLDVDKEVQIRAIETAKAMGVQGLLNDEDGVNFRETVYKMITEEDPDIRMAAADFIRSIYIDIDLAAEYSKSKKEQGKRAPNRDVYMAKGMVELFNVVADEIQDLHPVMEPLMQECDFLKDLGMLCDVMMQEDEEDCLDEEQKATLGRMILGVMATLSDLDEKDDSGHRTKKKNNPAHSNCKNATLLLGDKLPAMVRHFAADVSALTPLIGCLEHFMLEAFNAKDSSLKDLVEALVEITKKANDEELLIKCAIALEHFETEDFSAKSAVQANVKNLFKTMAADLKKVAEAFDKGSKLTTVQALALHRMVIVSGNCNVFKAEQTIRTSAVKMLMGVTNADSAVGIDSQCHALTIVLQYLTWSVLDGTDGPERMIEAKEELMSCCKAIFERGEEASNLLRVQAHACVADLHHILGCHLTEVSPSMLDFIVLCRISGLARRWHLGGSIVVRPIHCHVSFLDCRRSARRTSK